MKKAAVAVAVLVFAALMVLPIVRSVNLSAGKPVAIDRTLSANGWLEPPFPPKAQRALVADGAPLPWPFSLAAQTDTTLSADGAPLPWPFSLGAQPNTTLSADGAPLPWPFSTQSSQLA
jgi:hypothetical protein